MADHEYRSNFDDWDDKAWVRSGSRADAEFQPEQTFFSEALSPSMTSGAVRTLGPEIHTQILVHDLYRYLEFTVRLETGPVNEVCIWLRAPDFMPWLPQKMKDDALRIYTDEAGHAEMSNTLVKRVELYSGIRPTQHEPQFLRTLRNIYDTKPAQYRTLIQLFFVIVSETLITGSLSLLPRDGSVQEAVRVLAADHASDEGKHHSYFRQLFLMLWPRLPLPLKETIVPILPEMLRAFLEPDYRSIELSLRSVLPDLTIVPDTMEEIRSAPETAIGIENGARPTLKLFRSAGVFDLEISAGAFRKAGFAI